MIVLEGFGRRSAAGRIMIIMLNFNNVKRYD